MTRNETIAQMYRQGETQLEIAQKLNISKVRVGQILHQMGMSKTDRPKVSPFKRTAFTAVYLKESVKEALRQVAKDEGKPLSLFLSDVLEKELKTRGVPIIEPVMLETDVPLPLEA